MTKKTEQKIIYPDFGRSTSSKSTQSFTEFDQALDNFLQNPPEYTFISPQQHLQILSVIFDSFFKSLDELDQKSLITIDANLALFIENLSTTILFDEYFSDDHIYEVIKNNLIYQITQQKWQAYWNEMKRLFSSFLFREPRPHPNASQAGELTAFDPLNISITLNFFLEKLVSTFHNLLDTDTQHLLNEVATSLQKLGSDYGQADVQLFLVLYFEINTNTIDENDKQYILRKFNKVKNRLDQEIVNKLLSDISELIQKTKSNKILLKLLLEIEELS